MDALRKSDRISRFQLLRNEEVEKMINIKTNILQENQMKQLIWLGDLIVMRYKRLPGIIMAFNQNQIRKYRRSKETVWEDVKRALAISRCNYYTGLDHL